MSLIHLSALPPQFHHAVPPTLLLEGRVLMSLFVLLEAIQRVEIAGDLVKVLVQIAAELSCEKFDKSARASMSSRSYAASALGSEASAGR